ncbi:MAG: hypothetical protein Kow0062_03460 [Acidobacteriota bacterium]
MEASQLTNRPGKPGRFPRPHCGNPHVRLGFGATMTRPSRARPLRWTALLALAGLLFAGAHMAVPHEDGHGADHCAICTAMHGASPAVAAVDVPLPAAGFRPVECASLHAVARAAAPALGPRAPPVS